MNTEDNILQSAMSLITHGGNAKSCAMEAIYASKNKDYKLADEKLSEANESLLHAHKSQTLLLTKEA